MAAETSRERLARLRAEQDVLEALYDEIQGRVSPAEWEALMGFNTYCAPKLGLTVEVYRHSSGQARYRLRALTEAERQARADEWAEDTL